MTSPSSPTSPPGLASEFEDPAALQRRFAPPEDPAAEPAVMFPLRWYEIFLQEIRRLGIRVITYRDLFDDSDDWEHENYYRREFQHWQRHRRDPMKTHLLIQHDVDNLPRFTDRMIAMEAFYGIRSNIFIFRDRFSASDRNQDYPVDHAFLQEAERHGFVIGYHSNALQHAGFDLEAGQERFRSDVEYLQRFYDIRFMVPHGGLGGEIDGRMHYNYDLALPPELKGRIRWVFNRYGATFQDRYSDGGLRKSRDEERIARSDLVGSFLHRLKKGSRNFCLIHPQRWGYHVDMQQNPMLAAQPWYVEACRRHAAVLADGVQD